MKKKTGPCPPPGGRRAKPKKDMKKSAPCSTITAFTNNKEADVKKCTIKRSEIDFALRQKIERLWNVKDGFRHPSIREVARILRLAESTLRHELKRGCPEGVVCMKLRDGRKLRYQYFRYSAELAQQDARMKGAQKGPRGKLTNLMIDAFLLELVFWESIPAAWAMLKRKMPNIPCLRTFQYHVANGTIPTDIAGKEYYRPYGKRKRYTPPKAARNHVPEHRYADLPEAVKTGKSEGYAQCDFVCSGQGGKGCLFTLVLPFHDHKAYVRRLLRPTRRAFYAALRSVAEELKHDGLSVHDLLLDNDILFLDAKRIASIPGCTVYYADAYAGWQKGAVENLNKLVRRFYPKSTDFSKLTPGEIRLLQWKLTHLSPPLRQLPGIPLNPSLTHPPRKNTCILQNKVQAITARLRHNGRGAYGRPPYAFTFDATNRSGWGWRGQEDSA